MGAFSQQRALQEDAFEEERLEVRRALGGDEPPQPPRRFTRAEERMAGAVLGNLLEAADKGKLPEEVAKAVVLPEHYARFKIEPIRFIGENGLNFFQGNIIKYVLRWDAKDGIQDLKKARRYLDMFIKLLEGDPDWWQAPQKEAA